MALGTIVGTKGSEQVFGQIFELVDDPGNGASTLIVPFTPASDGEIVWTATILDNGPDLDEASAITSVASGR